MISPETLFLLTNANNDYSFLFGSPHDNKLKILLYYDGSISSMWYDNETDCDFVNFESIAKTVGEIIVQSNGEPVSIGVSGDWGVGKSSMIKLINKDLSSRNNDSQSFIFVTFNAWLYQGYDDARAALLDVIAQSLSAEAESNESAKDKVLSFVKKVNWLRVAGVGAQVALFASLGLPPIGLAAQITGLRKNLTSGKRDEETITAIANSGEKLIENGKKLLLEGEAGSPPQEIQGLRNSFEAALEALNKTLVVFIDDLDRCLPSTTISTLEAIRLFLFLKHTAFVIAADSHVIRHAVKKHFSEPEDSKLVTSYFDKLIQIPIPVPPLGTQEVRAYLILLNVYHDIKDEKDREEIRLAVCGQLAKSWEGKRVDQAFLEKYKDKISTEIFGKIESSTRLAHLLTISTDIAGNPRLIKRFLNALSIRESVAKAQGIMINTQALSKLLLLERCGGKRTYAKLISAVTSDSEGKPQFLKEWEEAILERADIKLPEDENSDFMREWLSLPPQLADLDLRRELYVSRESAALITPLDRLSTEGAKILSALIEYPAEAGSAAEDLGKLPKADMLTIVDKLLDKAKEESEWGTPPILEPLLVCANIDSTQAVRISGFFTAIPINQLKAGIVPRIGEYDWSNQVFESWSRNAGISGPMKVAIAREREKNGNFKK